MVVPPNISERNLSERLEFLNEELRLTKDKIVEMLGNNPTHELTDFQYAIFASLCDSIYSAAKRWHGNADRDFPFYLWPGYDSIRDPSGKVTRVQMHDRMIESEGSRSLAWDVDCGISPAYQVPSDPSLNVALSKEIADLLEIRRKGVLDQRLEGLSGLDAKLTRGLIPTEQIGAFRLLANPASIWFSILLVNSDVGVSNRSTFQPGSTHVWLAGLESKKALRGLVVDFNKRDKSDHLHGMISLVLTDESLRNSGRLLGSALDGEGLFGWPATARTDVERSSADDSTLRRLLYTPWLISVFKPDQREWILEAAEQLAGEFPSKLDYVESKIRRLKASMEVFDKRYPHVREFIASWSAYSHWYSLALDQSFAPSLGGQAGTPLLSLGTIMLFTGKQLDREFLAVLRPWIEQIYLTFRQFEGAKLWQIRGESHQKQSFAHQTSAVVDSLVQSVARLPHAVRDGMGGLLIAKLYLLQVVVTSYRSREAKVDLGEFAYPWKEASALEVYRDIGIQLGLARAQSAKGGEPWVRSAGRRALRPENQPGKPGFEEYRKLFETIPNVSDSLASHLKHANLAALVLLVLKQAVYHTLRATLCPTPRSRRIEIDIHEGVGETILVLSVRNPGVVGDTEMSSKDEVELKEMAANLSSLPDRPYIYEITGPRAQADRGGWVTTIEVRRDT